MAIDPNIFRAYDIRGIYKKNLDEEVMLKIGLVLGKEKQSFVVGRDIRKSGKSLAEALIKGLINSGSKVFYVGTASFGQTMFAGWFNKLDKILYITASHLPPEWNGLKPSYGNGISMPEREIKKIRDKVIKIKSPAFTLQGITDKQNLNLKKINIKKEYTGYLLDKFSGIKNNKLKIVVDCGEGAMCLSAPDVLKKIGFKVSELYCNVNPNFSGRGSEPTQKTTKTLQQKVKKEKADFGVAFDGDGDRAVIIDNKGRYLSGNVIGIIIAKDVLKSSKNKPRTTFGTKVVRGKKIVITVSCSMAFEKELKPLGAKIIRVPVGHTFMTLGCKKYNADFGIEESCHAILPECFPFDDALPVPLKIAEIILKEKKKLSELVDEIKTYPFEEVVFDCPDEKKFKVMKEIKRKFLKKYKNINCLDGVKVNFSDAWILVRVSNTSPIIRLYIEATTKEKLKKLKQKFSEIVNKAIAKSIKQF